MNRLIADVIDYVPKKIYSQTGPTCSAHSYFTCLSEHIQQKYGMEVEFDMQAGFDKMEAWRKQWQKVNVKRMRRLKAFMELGKDEGWRTLDGELVKQRGCMKMIKLDFDKLCDWLQKYGPIPFGIQLYEGHDINPSGDIVPPVPVGAKRKAGAHGMLLRGFDRPADLFKWHNSWGVNSIKYIKFGTFEHLFRYCYVPLNVTIQ